ncbi:flagellar hook-length control protein FliK [Thiogranum longum]
METSGPTSGTPRVSGSNAQAAATQWQVGQLLQATVADSSLGKVLLTIGNRQVSAETSLPLEKGQQLTLQVKSLGEQPVLRIASAPSESPVTAAVRLLLPRQGAMTPLLASMSQIMRVSNPPTPPLITQLVKSIVKQMPSAEAASTPQGLKKAINDSGVFLESHLRAGASQGGSVAAVGADLKANLLRLVQLVRNWPGSSSQSPTRASATGAPPAQQAGPTGSGPESTPASTPVSRPSPPTPGTGSQAPVPAAVTPGSTASPRAGPDPATQQASPDLIRRAVQAGTTDQQQAGVRHAPTAAPAGTPPAAAARGAGSLPASAPEAPLPPPFRGAVPVPQAALQASLDLLNRVGNLRTDLLQQSEAALARLQLSQLAALPKEGEPGLLEWLLELPIRRGDDIDLWSLRLFREPGKEQHQQEPGWSVQLAFDLPGLGPLQAHVQLSGERVSTSFWAERQDTLTVLRQHLHELREAMTGAGLEVAELQCRSGCMPAPKPASRHPLISEKV